MAIRGETTRSLGSVVNVTSAAVTGWCNGAVPRPAVAKTLADYFQISAEDLMDDRRELPAEVRGPSGVVAAPAPAPASRKQEDPAMTEQLIATLRSLQEQLTTQNRQIADLTAYIKAQGLKPPGPKGKN